MKATHVDEVKKLADIPKPAQLRNKDPFILYTKLSKLTGLRQDPCVLDTYIAVIDFMNGAPVRPWYSYTKERKAKYTIL
jgi:hypothetical protein